MNEDRFNHEAFAADSAAQAVAEDIRTLLVAETGLRSTLQDVLLALVGASSDNPGLAETTAMLTQDDVLTLSSELQHIRFLRRLCEREQDRIAEAYIKGPIT